jgi:hypothetical protein
MRSRNESVAPTPQNACYITRPAPVRNLILALRQARHLLELQNDPQGNYDVFDVTAAGSLVECTGNVAPRFTLSAFARQMNLYKLAHVGERPKRHDSRDFQRPRQLARPVRTGQGTHSSRNNVRLDRRCCHFFYGGHGMLPRRSPRPSLGNIKRINV